MLKNIISVTIYIKAQNTLHEIGPETLKTFQTPFPGKPAIIMSLNCPFEFKQSVGNMERK